jgi:hypothetical protein
MAKKVTKAKEVTKAIIADYQEASESGRDCSERIFQSFYLSLIFLALVITAIIEGYDSYPVVLPTISILSAFSFLILFVTIHINKGARNSAWARRKKIECEIDDLKTDESIEKRLVKECCHFSYRGKDRIEKMSAAKMMELFALVIFISWIIVLLKYLFPNLW